MIIIEFSKNFDDFDDFKIIKIKNISDLNRILKEYFSLGWEINNLTIKFKNNVK